MATFLYGGCRVVVRVVDVVDVVVDGGFDYGLWNMDYGLCNEAESLRDGEPTLIP